MLNKEQRRFVLIEIMLVAAIIATLAASALLAYQAYATRTNMSEIRLDTALVGAQWTQAAKPATDGLTQAKIAGEASRPRHPHSGFRQGL